MRPLRTSPADNPDGTLVIPGLPPEPYRIEVSKDGFKTVVRDEVVLRVQDDRARCREMRSEGFLYFSWTWRFSRWSSEAIR